jgi:uncharacterized protein involved in outer membrane biogenesis
MALLVLAGLAVLAGVVYVALVKAYPPQRLSALLSQEVSSATGRSFAIKGDLSIRLLPSLAVVAHGMTLGNAAWGTQPDMLSLRRAAFVVELRPLLEGRVRILSIDIEGARLLLETRADGRGNWLFDTAAVKPGGAASPAADSPRVALDGLVVTDGILTYRDGSTGATRALAVQSLAVAAQGDLSRLEAAVSLNGQALQVKGQAGRFDLLASARAPWPFDFQINTDGATLAAKGQVGPAAQGGSTRAELALRITAPAALAALGEQARAIPLPIEARATLQRAGADLRIEPIDLSVAGQALQARVAVLGAGEPRIEAQVSAATLDVGRWLGRAAAPTKPTRAGSGPKPPLFGDTPLPWPTLPGLPISLGLRVERLLLPGLPPLSAVAVTLTSEPGRLKVTPASFGMAQGQVGLGLDLALPTGGVPRAVLSVQASGVSVPELEAVAGSSRLSRGGHADLSTQLTLTGQTPRKLAASAQGDILLKLRDTALVSGTSALQANVLTGLLKALLPGIAADQPLPIHCAVVRLPLRNGRALIDRSVALETDRLSVAASGELNLAAQTLALSFRTATKKGLGMNAAHLAQMVSLGGPLQDPQVGVDLTGSARQLATLGLAGATGGLSLLATRMLGNAGTAACQAALAGSEAGPAGPTAPAARPVPGSRLGLPWSTKRRAGAQNR